MIPYKKEKMENAVCFFASEHRRKTRHSLSQTFLYKYLALFDFGHLSKYGKPALGLTYRAMQRGPVPLEIYGHRDDPSLSKRFILQEESTNHIIVIPTGKPDLDYFSKREIDLMNQLIEIYGQDYVTAHIMSDASHEKILAWKRTWKRQENALIDFSLEFPDNPFEKPEEQLNFPEEVFLIQQGLEHCI